MRLPPTSTLLVAAAAAAHPSHDANAVAVVTPVKLGAAANAVVATAAAPATPASGEMDQVRQLLRKLGLARYAGAFEAAGYDDAAFLMQLSADDAQRVAQTVGMKPGHALKFVHADRSAATYNRAHLRVGCHSRTTPATPSE